MASAILVVDDNREVGAFCSQLLAEAGESATAVDSGQAALELLKERAFDIVITDVSMPGISGFDLLRKIKATPGSPGVIMITGFGSVPDAVAAVKQGAFDYIEKPVEPARLLEAVAQLKELRREHGAAEYSGISPEEASSQGIVGDSEATRTLIDWIARVSVRHQPVLITGEAGTGKELVARAIHRQSGRRDLPFVTADCGALTHSTVDQELFGLAGARSAKPERAGLLAVAGSGTLFLDQVGDLPPETQAKLFRVLQDRQFRHLGSDQTQRFEARIIAATTKNLDQAMQTGRFRPDLYYRLNVHSIELTPLRERREDIPALLHYFLKRDAPPGTVISSDALAVLENHDWPGNIRELENCVVSMLARGDGPVLGADQLPPQLHQIVIQAADRTPLEQAERQALIQALRQSGGQVGEAAAKLGVSQATLYRKLSAHGLRASSFRV